MAIEINKLITFNNLTLDYCYIRLGVNLSASGNYMNIKSYIYQNKSFYLKNKYGSNTLIPNFQLILNTPYIISDGEAVLFAHNRYIEYLTTDKVNKNPIILYDISGNTISPTNNTIIEKINGITTISINNDVVYMDRESKNTYTIEDNSFILTQIIEYKFFEPTDVSIVDLN